MASYTGEEIGESVAGMCGWLLVTGRGPRAAELPTSDTSSASTRRLYSRRRSRLHGRAYRKDDAVLTPNFRLLCRFCGCLRRRRAAWRGRPSQVKGAFGVATRWRARATLDLRASTAPPGSVAGRQGPALHNARHPRRPQPTSTDDRIPAVSAGQPPRANEIVIMESTPGNVSSAAENGSELLRY